MAAEPRAQIGPVRLALHSRTGIWLTQALSLTLVPRLVCAPQDFLMPVEGTSSIAGRGTVVTGSIESGVIKPGDEIEIVGIRKTQKTTVTGVQMFHKDMEVGEAGDNVGCLLRGLKREDVQRGQVICKPGTIKPTTKFQASIYALTKEENGRHTPFFSSYRPQFFFRTADVTGSIMLDGDRQVGRPAAPLSPSLVSARPHLPACAACRCRVPTSSLHSPPRRRCAPTPARWSCPATTRRLLASSSSPCRSTPA